MYKTIDSENAADGDCDFEANLKELLVKSQSLIADYDLLEKHEINLLTLNLLHCHILPIIALHVEDIFHLEQLRDKQNEYIRKLEGEMIQKDKNLDAVQSSIDTQCDQHVTELLKLKKIHYPLTFSKILLGDLHLSAQRAQDKLNDLQHAVDQIKVKDSENAADLEQKRELRNQAHVKYQNLLKAREQLQLYLTEMEMYKSSLSKKVTNDQLYNVYMGLDQMRSGLLNELREMLDKKLLLLSVSEALRWTIENIRSKGVSFGFDSDAIGRKSTDVLRHSSIPIEWRSLSEQVCSIVTDKHTAIGKDHIQMVQSVIDQCNQVRNIYLF